MLHKCHCQSVYITLTPFLQFALTSPHPNTLASALRCMHAHTHTHTHRSSEPPSLAAKHKHSRWAESHILAVFSSVWAWIHSQSAQPGYDTVGMQKIALSPQAEADLCQNIK